MPRRALLLAVLALILALAAPARADELAWTAWLYTGYGDLARIADDGTVVQAVKIPYTSRTLDEQSPYLSVSPSGRFLAYTGAESLFIMDTTTEHATRIAVDNHVFNSFYVVRQPRLFNHEETALAFGTGNSDYQNLVGTWEINVFAVATGETLHTLRDTDPASQALELPGFNFVPLIQHFADGQFSFILLPDGMESGPHYASYTWTLDTGEVKPNGLYTFLGFDLLSGTGEIIFPVADSRFPTFPCEGECGQFVHWNTLRVYHPSTDTVFPFFSTPTLLIVGIHFIQNGERVLALTYDLENFTWNTNILAVVDRDSTLVSQFSVENLTAVRGVTGGFIYTTDESNTLMFVDTRNEAAEPAPLFTSPTDTPVLLLWASPPDAGITYQPWANLTPPE